MIEPTHLNAALLQAPPMFRASSFSQGGGDVLGNLLGVASVGREFLAGEPSIVADVRVILALHNFMLVQKMI